MHVPLYRTVSTTAAFLVLGAGLSAQILEVERTSRARTPRGEVPVFRRWEPPSGLLGEPSSANETYFTVDR